MTAVKSQVIFSNGNIAGVYNNPTRPTTFTINQPYVITLIQNYHWNNAKGSNPGTIALKDQSSRTYGPWQAKGSPGQGGVPNAYWTVYPNITLPAGTYTVIDSEPSTWAQNSGSGGAGHTRIEGHPAEETGNQQIGNTVQQGRTINAEQYIFQGHRYALTKIAGNWDAVNQEAKEKGGYLVVIDSAEENEWLVKTFGDGPYWIGLFQNKNAAEPGGGWEWVNGTMIFYSNWDRGQPDNYTGRDNYGFFLQGSRGRWHDVPLEGWPPTSNYKGIIEFE